MRPIAYQRPQPPGIEAIAAHFAPSVQAGWFTRGPAVTALGERTAQLTGAAHGVPTSSATIGLMLVLRALAGPPDRERLVVVPSFVCPAVAGAVEWAGFTPLFADVEPRGWHLDPVAIDAALAEHAGAIVAVIVCAQFGTPPDPAQLAAWEALTDAAGVPLVFDAAAGLGAVRASGAATVYSLEATKPSGVGEGGIVVTEDAALADELRRLANYGMRDGIVHATVGLNGKLSELGAAAALAELDILSDALSERRRRGMALSEPLRAAGATLQAGVEESAWDAVHVVLDSPQTRATALARAAELQVETRTLWDPPLHCQPAWAGARIARAGLVTTESLAPRSLALPMAVDLSDEELQRIADVLRSGSRAG
jgi:dTDP-4-amino-4,6-dideoxygalactose transaminase